MNIDENTIIRAIEKWGQNAQLGQLAEECTELSLAAQKIVNRGPTIERYENLIEEIADVNIMIAQANIMFPSDKIQEVIDKKLARLNSRIDKSIF